MVRKGSGFRGLLNYLRDGKKNDPRIPPGEIIGGNLSGQDPRELSAELAAVRRLRPDCKRPVLHFSLSLPAGQDLTPQQWQQAARTFMEKMGIDPERHPHVLYKHVETAHQHIHLVVSRIGIDGSLAREARGDFKLAHKAAAAASLAVGLAPQPKPAPEHRQPDVTKYDRREIEAGETPVRLSIAARLDEAIAQATSWEDVKTRAVALGMEIQEATNAGGVYGIKCRLAGGDWIKGSQVGKAYTYSSILKRLQAGGADIAQGPAVKPRRDILERLQVDETKAGTVYRWASGHVAVVDLGNALQWRTGSAAEAAALAAVAKAKGWQSIQMADRGDREKNDLTWLAYARAGIAVTNHKPSEKVYEQWVAERDRSSAGALAQPSSSATVSTGEAGRNDGRGAPASRAGGQSPELASANPGPGGLGDQIEQSELQPRRLDQGARQANEKARGRRPAVVEKTLQLNKEQVHDTSATTHQPNARRIGSEPPPGARGRLRSLSELGMVRLAQGGEVLLPGHVPPDLDDARARPDRQLRRDDVQLTLNEAQERALWRDLSTLIERFAVRAGGDRAKREIRDMLPQQIRDRLRSEKDDTERRRLLLQFSANLISPAHAPEGLDDARNLLAHTASQEALEAAIKTASEQQRPISTPQPAPGPRPASGPRMNP